MAWLLQIIYAGAGAQHGSVNYRQIFSDFVWPYESEDVPAVWPPSSELSSWLAVYLIIGSMFRF
jgi:hypothetical protein